MAALAGAGAKNCESTATNDVNPGAISEPCLIQAFRKHEAAYWVPASAVDGIRGIAVAADGVVHIVEGTDPTPDVHRCDEPKVLRLFGRERLRCAERFVMPYKAESIPFRAGNDVRPPCPKAPIRVPPRACDPTAPGRKLQVELIVDTSGKVLFVDLLGIPKECDLPALESYLDSIEFEPATLNGAPVIASWFTIAWLR
jgi:hypothetical protein